MSKHVLKFVLILVIILGGVLPAMAQDEMPLPGEVVIADLGAPRGIAFDANGNLLIADAGTGGADEITMAGPEGASVAQAGLTGRIISVAPDGTATDLLAGFPSYALETETLGIYRAIPNGDSLWVIYSGAGPTTTGAFWQDVIVEYDAATWAVLSIVNLNSFEVANDPDGNGYDSNVADLAWGPDGTLYIADAGGNDLLSWTEADGMQVVAAWPDNSVPTSVEVAENGDIYVGFLGAGIAPGAAKIERWSGGELAETFSGLTAVTDILLDGDTLYAVQLMIFGDAGPGAGNVVTVTAEGATPVAEGIPAAFGIAKGPDGALYVSYGTIALAPGVTGGVLKLAQ